MSIRKGRFIHYGVFLLGFLGLGVASGIRAQGTGTLEGILTDGSLEEPLAFANVGITSLGLGTTTELNGSYVLDQVPAGTYTVAFSYLGYGTVEETVSITAGARATLNVTLRPDGVTMTEIVVSTQAVGQRAAINQQINSNTIVNVVSKERLQEMPDQNAAESVGRLPGVSIQRDGGEGQRVVVRGMSPRFSSITVNGVRVPSTDAQDRSVDLSMISPDALAGIELFKALRPDMDGDAIGGTVNFTARKAPSGREFDLRILKGYNDHQQSFLPFRGSFSASQRSKNEKLGAILTGNFQRADRSADGLNVDYSYDGIDPASGLFRVRVDNLRLIDQLETRDRLGGSLTLDWTPNTRNSIVFNSNYGRTNRDELRRRRSYRVEAAYQEYDIRQRSTNINLLSNTLDGDHKLGKGWRLKWLAAYAATAQRTPEELGLRFREQSAQRADIVINQGPDAVIPGFFNNLDETFVQVLEFNQTDTEESNTTGRVDLQYDFRIGGNSTGFFKTGLSYRATRRERDNGGLIIRPYLPAENVVVLEGDRDLFITDANGRALLVNFLGGGQIRPFLGGDYDFGPGTPEQRQGLRTPLGENIDLNAYNAFFNTNYQPGDALGYDSQLDMAKVRSFFERYRSVLDTNVIANQEDYAANEDIYGAYAMAQLNLGKAWMLMGGVRLEDTRQNYRSANAAPLDEDAGGSGFGALINQEASQGYAELLPMAHLRYKPSEWFDVRLAVTKSLARPNFLSLVPWERINNTDREINRGRPDLLHTTAWNYDAYVSFYNKFGLFTVGVFQKDFFDTDYIRTYIIRDPASRFRGYQVTEPENVPESSVRGLEFDLQANFASLPKPWRGLILGANLTLAKSQTSYPVSFIRRDTVFLDVPPFVQITTAAIDTLRSGRNVGQANTIANLTLGYELGRFSTRLSMLYQDNAFDRLGARGELDGFTARSVRWDYSLTYWVNKKRSWQIVANVNNISNQPEQSFVGNTSFLSESEFYGMTADLGLRFRWQK
ncbi:TonB-dependent receptor [Neolewinella lacunae]|uniref:TonB-dependent receptor n=1 Tax=Neolewinella lacunae TaxID=1517758 RepID=A0A923TDU1_9BACT|nr:TonB-dependent receptor [Neolewinella lacunae]MBC6995217.1 TonB-dependent receptor [Neolewinella lacunae]MDN3635474.1 TonB-dependent receptor [Neolewinella lacunae]